MPLDLDILPADVQQLLQLFSSLPDVRFPDLEPAALQDAVARLHEKHRDVTQLEAELEAARIALDDEQEALLKKSHRLLAYLKVYAEHDEALAGKVNALALPRLKKAPVPVKPAVEGGPDAPAPRKRGRPRKVPSTDALFAEAAAATSA